MEDLKRSFVPVPSSSLSRYRRGDHSVVVSESFTIISSRLVVVSSPVIVVVSIALVVDSGLRTILRLMFLSPVAIFNC